jgi:hypothetical protein
MFKKLIVLSSVLFILTAGAATASAQWDNLGSKEVKDRNEQDTWHLSGKGQYRRLKITVQHRAVNFHRLRVTYGNGEQDEIPIAALIRAGGETRAIDLEGKDRHIRKVDVWYDAHTARRGRRSQVTLYGMK